MLNEGFIGVLSLSKVRILRSPCAVPTKLPLLARLMSGVESRHLTETFLFYDLVLTESNRTKNVYEARITVHGELGEYPLHASHLGSWRGSGLAGTV